MPQISFDPNKAYPSIPTVGSDLNSHSRAIEAIKEALQIHERRSKDVLNSFVRVQELADLGLIQLDGSIVEDITPIDESTTHHHNQTYIRLDGTLGPTSYIQFDTEYSDGVAEGKLQWNIDDGTLEFGLPGGQVNLQIGQEQVIRCRNTTGSQISNGAVVYIVGSSGNRPLIALADASLLATAHVLGMATENIAHNDNGYVNVSGLVRDVDTSGMTEGDELWLGTTPGGFTNIRPVPPAQLVAIGTAVTVHATEGIVLSHPDPSHRESDLDLMFMGAALDSPDVSVSSNGSTITLSLEEDGGGDIRFVFSSGTLILDCTPAATITLTAGTDIAPTLNYIYVLESTSALGVSTSSWPAIEHAPIATVLCQSAASAQTDGLYKVHAWTDHVADAVKGHLGHLNYWIRSRPAGWLSGTLAVATAGAGTFDLAVSSGEVLQLHPHAFPSFDTSTGSEVMVINDSVTPYVRLGDLTSITLDAAGTSLTNRYFNLVIWGVISEDSGDCQIMVNLPLGVYTLSADAQTDIDGTAIYDIPAEYIGTGFLIARLTMRLVGTTYTEVLNTDLRGSFPSTTAGGSGGGGGGAAELIELTDVNVAADTANFFLATPDGVTGQYSGRAITPDDIPDLSTTYSDATHNHTSIHHEVDTSNIILSGGSGGGAGGNIELYGPGHLVFPNEIFYDAALHRFRSHTGGSETLTIEPGVGVDINVALTASSFGGITSGNLLDKTADETVDGQWTFTDNLAATAFGGITSGNLLDKTAAEQVSGQWSFTSGVLHIHTFSIEHQFIEETGTNTAVMNLQSGHAGTLDLSDPDFTGTVTFSLTNVPSEYAEFSLVILQDPSSALAVTWPAGFDFPGGTAPDLSVLSSRTLMAGSTRNSGSGWDVTFAEGMG